MLIHVLLWLLFGGLAGWIATMIIDVNQSRGALPNIIIGMIGAVLGGFIVQTLVGIGFTGLNISSLVVAVIGSVIFLALARGFTRI